MAGYTRQSTASIINGSNITAPPLNTEFNQLQAAFNATSGHTHTGGTGDAPKINLATSVSGYLPAVHGGIGGKNTLDATTTPVATNDNTEGYAPGSMWENTNTGRIYICVGSSSNAAVWRELLQVQNGNSILPAATDTVDIGSNTVRFQDLFLSGGIAAAGNTTVGGTLNITGATALGSTLGVTGDTTLANLSATGTTVITSVDLNSGAIDNTTIGSATPAAGTFTTLNANTSLVAATADINGGSLDGATVGASVPSTGSFTTLGASGTSTLATVDINGGNIDGTVIGASTTAAGSFTTLSTSGQATLASADINGGSIDGSTIGANSASTGAFTTLTASGGITGSLTGNVTGNTAGVHTGAVTGNVTGNLTGNVTAGSGTSTFTNLVVNGNLNMNAGTSATITNLTAPSSDLDAATKKYVDDEISTLIGDAGAGLDTLGELADALNDDDDFSTTVTNSIATKLPKAGGTMTGAIAMSTNKITGAGDPTSAQDVSTKVYTDTQRDTRVAKTGDTMSGALAMGNNKITGLSTPTAGTDVTNKTYVDGILGSATVAATSATNAATSETNAATSATSSANSAAASLVSKNAAATSLSTFQNQYLGAQSSAPTQDPDGSALDVGDLYFDTVANAMKVYSSSGWTNAGSSVNGTSNRVTYTATAGQTVFAATYDSGYIDTFLNGVKLLSGTDFTATNGTSITLASGASVNDVVDIVAYGTFELADHYTRTASDARYVQPTHTGNLDITGTVTSDKFSITEGELKGNSGNLQLQSLSTGIIYDSANGYHTFRRNGTNAMQINGGTGDISFYNSAGSAAKFFWDSSAESLGIGTSSPTALLHLSSSAPSILMQDSDGTGRSSINCDNGSLNLKFNSNNAVGTSVLTFNDFNTERMRIDSSGNVGIGTDNPAGELEVKSTGDADLYIRSGDSNAGSIYFASASDSQEAAIRYFNSNNSLRFYGHDMAEAMRIDSSGNVGIAVTSPDNRLVIASGSDGTGNGDGVAFYGGVSNKQAAIESYNVGGYSGDLRFYTGNKSSANTTVTERMRITSSGNLLVGTTDTSPYDRTSGNAIAMGDGLISSAQSGGNAAIFNRMTSVGSIIGLNYNGSAIGSIGVQGSRPYFGNSINFSIKCDDANNGSLVPSNQSGVPNNNVSDIGLASNRWNDLYLGGGVYFGGTGSTNKLDDYEEGTWTPTIVGGGTAGTYEASLAYGVYTKIGRQVQVQFVVTAASSLTGGGTSYLRLTGLPFNYNAGEKEISCAVRSNISFTGSYLMAAHDAGGANNSLAFYSYSNSGTQTLEYISRWGVNKFIKGNFSYITTA